MPFADVLEVPCTTAPAGPQVLIVSYETIYLSQVRSRYEERSLTLSKESITRAGRTSSSKSMFLATYRTSSIVLLKAGSVDSITSSETTDDTGDLDKQQKTALCAKSLSALRVDQISSYSTDTVAFLKVEKCIQRSSAQLAEVLLSETHHMVLCQRAIWISSFSTASPPPSLT